MIRMTLTDDAPEIQMIEGEPGFVRIESMTTADEEDSVVFQTDEKAAPVAVPVAAQATQRTTIKSAGGSQVVEMRVRERDLPDYGNYEIKCFTRRKQPRVYAFSIVKGEEEGQLSFVIDPKTTPCSWVTENDVYTTSKTEKITIPAQL